MPTKENKKYMEMTEEQLHEELVKVTADLDKLSYLPKDKLPKNVHETSDLRKKRARIMTFLNKLNKN